MIGHAFKHLETEAVLGGLIHLTEEVSVRNSEEVM